MAIQSNSSFEFWIIRQKCCETFNYQLRFRQSITYEGSGEKFVKNLFERVDDNGDTSLYLIVWKERSWFNFTIHSMQERKLKAEMASLSRSVGRVCAKGPQRRNCYILDQWFPYAKCAANSYYFIILICTFLKHLGLSLIST